jgi:hypothetical protein
MIAPACLCGCLSQQAWRFVKALSSNMSNIDEQTDIAAVFLI